MPNPYAPRQTRRANQAVSELEGFLTRLHKLGADQEALDEVRVHWAEFDDDWTPELRARLVAASDRDLRRMIMGIDDEFEHDTTTEDDAELKQRAVAVEAAEIEAADVLNGTVPEVLDWVGDSAVRAIAVSNLERGPDGAGRSTLLEAIDKIIDAT